MIQYRKFPFFLPCSHLCLGIATEHIALRVKNKRLGSSRKHEPRIVRVLRRCHDFARIHFLFTALQDDLPRLISLRSRAMGTTPGSVIATEDRVDTSISPEWGGIPARGPKEVFSNSCLCASDYSLAASVCFTFLTMYDNGAAVARPPGSCSRRARGGGSWP